jgi:hypothetical protein
MSKIIKTLSAVIGISAFCLTLTILSSSIVAQAETPRGLPNDFEEDSSNPSATPSIPCIEGETCPTNTPSEEPPATLVTTVSCENLATVVRKGDKSAVLITWKTTEFGGNYTPQERCRIVSARFNSKVQANNGSLQGLLLTNGPVNNRMVICALRPGEYDCSVENMLFTLKKENENNAGAVLGRLLNISVTGSGSAIEENSGQQVKVDMGTWASRNLRSTGNASTNHRTTPTTPSNRRPANTGF